MCICGSAQHAAPYRSASTVKKQAYLHRQVARPKASPIMCMPYCALCHDNRSSDVFTWGGYQHAKRASMHGVSYMASTGISSDCRCMA
mmetsp:Transcript_3767/g.8060  ORF Transcript_3767/g.8060 Transcript_3767/m.8060 type:complete len:88 (+) Transcript_3767:21-284(+)